jgi:SAM-dependent methyltransferase
VRERRACLTCRAPEADDTSSDRADRSATQQDHGVFDEVIPVLADPRQGSAPVMVAVRSRRGARIVEGAVNAPDGGESRIDGGIWEAMGDRRPHRTLAQRSNVLPPTPQLYEAVWRRRSLSLLSPRRFPIEEELGEMCAVTEPGRGGLAVDVACSEGLYARELARLGMSVVAVDHSRPFLRRVVQRSDRWSRRVSPVRALAQHLPLTDSSVDVVVMGGSLNEVGDQRRAVHELGRVLAPGGRWFLMCLLPASRPVGRLAQTVVGPSGITFPDRDTVERWCAEAGLRVTYGAVDGVVLRLGGDR